MKPSNNLLMVADSEHDANMLYAVGMFVPDPFIYLRLRGRPYIVMSDLEVDRARRTAPHCRMLSLSKYQERLRRAGIKSPGLAHVIREILRAKGVRRVLVPSSFPLGLATALGRLRISVRTRAGNVFPQREQKSPAEVKRISAALVMAETEPEESDVTVPFVPTASWGYLRLRRAAYTEADVAAWADRVRAQAWERAFVFFKHEDEARGPEFAATFARRIQDAPAAG